MAYVSTNEEVDTHELIKMPLKGQTVYIPKIDRNELKIIPLKAGKFWSRELLAYWSQ